MVWKEKTFGKNICVTRSRVQAKELREKLSDLGAQVTEINAIKIKSRDDELEKYVERLKDYKFIVLTSVNAVNILFDYLVKKEYDIRNIKGRFAVIGPATEKALLKRGIKADIIAKEFVAEDLFNELKPYLNKDDKIFVPHSKQARQYLVEALKDKGCHVEEVYSYEVVKGEVPNLEIFDDVDIVLYTSPSIVRNMIDMIGLEKLKKKTSISIGPITAKELDKNGIDYIICDEYTTDGMIEKLLTL